MRANCDIECRTIAVLNSCEVYRGQVFHDGHLWEGHSAGSVEDYRLDVHAADGTPIASAPVPHTLEFLYPFGPHAILVVGKHHTRRAGWLTYHTTARFDHGRLTVTTRAMPAELQVEQFGGCPGMMFFNETGTRTVFRWQGSRAIPVGHEIRMPGTILVLPGSLFVLERNRIAPGAENVVRIDLSTGRIARTFTTPRNGIVTLLTIEGWPWIAAVESWAGQVLLIDSRTNALAYVLPAAGAPADAIQVGRHLIVLCREPKRLLFFDLAVPGVPEIGHWDLARLGDGFANPTTMHADPHSGTIFLRSPYHPTIEGNVPSVAMVSARRS